MATELEQAQALTKWRKSERTLMEEELTRELGIQESDCYGWKAARLWYELVTARLELKRHAVPDGKVPTHGHLVHKPY